MKQIGLILVLLASSALGESFSEEAWQSISPLYEKIRTHPFNSELASGKLPREKFEFYEKQDALYLSYFRTALKALVLKLDDTAQARAVQDLAESVLEKTGVSEGERAPATFAYTEYLLATSAHRTKEELAAALLPCFWIYLRVADDLARSMRPDTPYRAWITLYSSVRYRAQVKSFLEVTDRLAARASPSVRAKMLLAFQTATRLELWFWEMAYRQQRW